MFELKILNKENILINELKNKIFNLLKESYKVHDVREENITADIDEDPIDVVYPPYKLPYENVDDMINKVHQYKIVIDELNNLYAAATYENDKCTLIGNNILLDKNKDAVKIIFKDDFKIDNFYWIDIHFFPIVYIEKKYNLIKIPFPYIYLLTNKTVSIRYKDDYIVNYINTNTVQNHLNILVSSDINIIKTLEKNFLFDKDNIEYLYDNNDSLDAKVNKLIEILVYIDYFYIEEYKFRIVNEKIHKDIYNVLEKSELLLKILNKNDNQYKKLYEYYDRCLDIYNNQSIFKINKFY